MQNTEVIMSRIKPLSPRQLADFKPMFDVLENTMGYIPIISSRWLIGLSY